MPETYQNIVKYLYIMFLITRSCADYVFLYITDRLMHCYIYFINIVKVFLNQIIYYITHFQNFVL